MPIEFKLPELGENIESGDLVRLMVKPGARISEGDSVMELETDKAVVEVPSSVTGTIGEVRVKEGDKLRVGQVIFTVENGAGATADKAPPKAEKAPSQSPAAPGISVQASAAASAETSVATNSEATKPAPKAPSPTVPAKSDSSSSSSSSAP